MDEEGDIRVSLYKVLLFIKIAQAIKGGVLISAAEHEAHYALMG